MFIQTEDTPNPASMKFLPGQPVLGEGKMGMDFPSREASGASPLAQALFDEAGVEGVFLGADFVTVTKADGTEWHHIKPAILGTIADYLTAGMPVIEEGTTTEDLTAGSPDDYEGETKEIVEQIVELIDTRVRPAVANDGGDIIFHKYEADNGIVYLTMRGACAGCPSSTITLKNGIENLLRHYVPEVQAVEAVM